MHIASAILSLNFLQSAKNDCSFIFYFFFLNWSHVRWVWAINNETPAQRNPHFFFFSIRKTTKENKKWRGKLKRMPFNISVNCEDCCESDCFYSRVSNWWCNIAPTTINLNWKAKLGFHSPFTNHQSPINISSNLNGKSRKQRHQT